MVFWLEPFFAYSSQPILADPKLNYGLAFQIFLKDILIILIITSNKSFSSQAQKSSSGLYYRVLEILPIS